MVSNEVNRDHKNGIHDARRILSLLDRHCPGFEKGEIEIFRALDGSSVSTLLDTIAGWDGFQCWNRAMRGFAIRVQWEKNWRTFTVRENRPSGGLTEYQKRLFAVNNSNEGYIFPHWTIQSYMTGTGGDVLSIGLAKTRELFPWIEQHELREGKFERKRASNGYQGFFSVPWDAYKQSGLYFFEYTPSLEIEAAGDERIVADPNAKDWQAL